MSDPTLSDIDLKNKMARIWTTLKNIHFELEFRVFITQENNNPPIIPTMKV